MATSLAEQLREVVALRCRVAHMVPIHEVTLVKIADEFERLQRENAELRADAEHLQTIIKAFDVYVAKHLQRDYKTLCAAIKAARKEPK